MKKVKFKSVKVDADTVQGLIELTASLRFCYGDNEVRFLTLYSMLSNLGMADQYQKYIDSL